ncbi:MAG: hypothetical protein PWP41_1112 [Moorella sp. (in: firmicutes)]|nr:hypothetical protein [Moorella sp. (in: firmicutes)]
MFTGPKVVTLLNFDDTLTKQEELRRFPQDLVDLRDLKGTRMYCAPEALGEIAARLGRAKRGITLIGSGDFHYVSYLLLAAMTRPFTLILFDYHADLKDDPMDAPLSCASWVARALELSYLQKAIIIGARGDEMRWVPPRRREKVLFLSCTGMGWLRQVIDNSTGTVYISIDKDVLCREDAVTNWEQGSLTLAELLLALREIAQQKEVAAADVCGEASLHPLDQLCPAGREAIRKNMRANVMILRTLLLASSYKKAS